MKSKNIIAVGLVILVGFILALLLVFVTPDGNQSESNGHEADGGHEEGGELKHLSQEGIEIEIGLSKDRPDTGIGVLDKRAGVPLKIDRLPGIENYTFFRIYF